MKLKEGMYVRIKNLKGIEYLGMLININDFREPSMKYCIDIQASDYVFISEDMILNANHNIIELIKNKDLVIDTKNNVYLVDKVEDNYVFTTSKNEDGLIKTLCDYQIKSVVTKELYEEVQFNFEEIIR